MMQVWTVANQKGGVGKTTTTVSLGGLLAAWGLRTLMVDIDPHGSLTSYFRYDPDALETSSYSLFQAAVENRALDPREVIYATGTQGLSLMPASVALATLDRQSGHFAGLGLVLTQALAQLSDDFDYVLVDCPPILGVVLINALAACDRLLIPVQTEFLAIKGLERMLQTLKMVTRARPAPLEYLVIPTFFDQRTRASQESLVVLRRNHAGYLWDGLIPIDTQFRESSRAGVPPALYDPHTHGVAAYTDLLAYLLAPKPGCHDQASA